MDKRNETNELDRQIGEKIGLLRGDETQTELADAIGVSREIIQHWERGTRKIKAGHLCALANHFGTSVDYLLGLEPEENSTSDAKLRTVFETTGLSNDAVQKLITWKNSNDRRKRFSELLSKIINSDNSESLFGYIGEFLLYSNLEIKAFDNSDPDFMNELSVMEEARLWNISRIFTKTIEALASQERCNQ